MYHHAMQRILTSLVLVLALAAPAGAAVPARPDMAPAAADPSDPAGTGAARPDATSSEPADRPSSDVSAVEPIPDDADRDSLLAALGRSAAYLAAVRKPALMLLGKPVPTTRFRQSVQRLAELVRTAWGTPAFDRALRTEFEWVGTPGNDGQGTVRFTGYHLPLLEARHERDATFRYPVYAPPPDMLGIALGAFKPNWAGTVLVGRVRNGMVVPYYTRAEIEDDHVLAGNGLEIAWVSDELGLFSMMVQGSGLLHFPDGQVVNANYAAQNGRPYVGLGKAMVASGQLSPDQLSMPGITAYFARHPDQLHATLNRNPSYVFFKLAPEGPFGVDGIPLTGGRSIATDKKLFPSGAIAYIQYPHARFNARGQVVGWEKGGRFVLDQDTGGAIQGPGRVDIFYGGGDEAARRAGTLNGNGHLSVLLLEDPATPRVAPPRL